jgi:hypothetical protein
MGTLAQGFGGSAQGAANDSFAWSRAATGLSAGGELAGGLGGFQLANYQAAVAANNAKIAAANAQAATASGSFEESAEKEKTGQVVGEQAAAYGAHNIDVNVGSPVAVKQSTQTVGALDAAMIHYNAAKAAFGFNVEAGAERAQSQLAQLAGLNALTTGITKSASTLLGGAASVSGRYAQWQLQAGGSSGGGS